MIVSELIKELEKLPQDKTVLGRGYESGYDELDEVTTQTLVKCETEWYDGDYQSLWNGKPVIDKPIDTAKEYICLG